MRVPDPDVKPAGLDTCGNRPERQSPKDITEELEASAGPAAGQGAGTASAPADSDGRLSPDTERSVLRQR
jgi:hypothetical protein